MADITTQEAALAKWYANVSARYVDLVGDYAGKERFFIEGDNLLLECFGNEKLDFENGFQVLHAVFLVEQYLHRLQQRGCQFDVVFFHDSQYNCVPQKSAHPPRYLLTRKILIHHLRKHATAISIHRFDSFQDRRFQEYLESSSVYFACCSDGTRNAQRTGKSEGTSQISYNLRSRIAQLLQKGLDVALLNGLECQDSKVFAFVLERSQELPECQLSMPVATSSSGSQSATIDPSELKELTTTVTLVNKGYLSSRLTITMVALRDLSHSHFMLPCIEQALLLDDLSLSARRTNNVYFDEGTEATLGDFIDDFCNSCLRNFDPVIRAGLDNDNSMVDLFDGRILRMLVADNLSYNNQSLPASAKDLCQILTAENSQTHKATSVMVDDPTNGPQNTYGATLLPFSHPAFDKHLLHVKVPDQRSPTPLAMGNKLSQELTHWHNSRKGLHVKKSAPQDPFQKKRAMRSNQRFMAEMFAYASSLTGANGKGLKPELVLVGTSRTHESRSVAVRGGQPSSSAPKVPNVQAKPAKKSRLKPKDEKIAATLATKAEETNNMALTAWKRTRELIDSCSSPQEKFGRADTYLADIRDRKDDKVVEVEAELYKLRQLLAIMVQMSGKADTHHEHLLALIYEALLRLAGQDDLPLGSHKILMNVAKGFNMKINASSPPESPRPISFPFSIPSVPAQLVIADPTRFRLLHTEPYMERSVDSRDDGRVSFQPDAWQRKVLDHLDDSRSLLVVAPTSSGKTFISFYAMEKALRANDDDVVVYVTPTKALVNQVAAEVQARFNKNYKYPGKTVWAIHTRDYRVNNPISCQILVTVPAILQIMLLSPSNAKWVPRIKSVIFDEVHTIGNADDGLVWEQLLLSVPSQIIALSATVGNPEAFREWLSDTQATMGRRLEIVVYEHRFSDLRKFIHRPPPADSFVGLPKKPAMAPVGLSDGGGLKYMHPVSCLRYSKCRLPSDLALESRDCVFLCDVMYKLAGNLMPPHLAAGKFFDTAAIKKADVIEWAGQLKAVLSSWMISNPRLFTEVVEALGSAPVAAEGESNHMQQNTTQFEHGFQAVTSTHLGVVSKPRASGERLRSTTLPLLCRLRSENALPAILFNYNRSACEDIVRHLLGQLVEAEERFKAHDPKWLAKMASYKEWKASATARHAKAKDARQKGGKNDEEGMSKLDRNRDAADSGENKFAGFDPNEPLDAFSFAEPQKLDREAVERYIDYFQWRGIDGKLIEAFRRGIAVHHSGMNRKYRQAVEMSFRAGFLTVVVATGTLSLGINMPCKTVVFSGDSVFLTALNYRQSAGRAGRRGFDLIGNVVFQDITLDKVKRLMASRLPDLNGRFPLTTSFVLRLLGLLHGTQDAPYAMKMVDSLLSQPRLYLGGESFKHSVLHHVRFSIEYLRTQGIVGAEGEPLNFASCVSHLYFTEKGAFAFHALLRGGVFHDLSGAMLSNEMDALRSLMLIMSHLFARVQMRTVDKESELELINRSASVVFLPSLPLNVARVLDEHNLETLSIYQKYVETFVHQHCSEPDDSLPITKIACRPALSSTDNHPIKSLPPARLRSPFVALSGHGDHFESVSDLCDSVRSGVFLEKAVVPQLDMGKELTTPLNAYLYDFYMHGQVQALQEANCIRRSDVWFLLNDFSLVLATIVASLENFFKAGNNMDLDLDAVGAVADEIEIEADESEEKEDVLKSETSSGISTKTAKPSGETATKAIKKKSKVADSWDDGESSEDEQVSTGPQSGAETAAVGSEDDEGDVAERRLKKVLVMFQKLKIEFDTKFRKIFA